MKHDNRDELLDELLAGKELEDFRQASLQRGLALIRRRRRDREFGRIAAMVILPVLLALVLWTNHSIVQIPQSTFVSGHRPKAVESKVRLINDDELLALFPNRARAIIGSPGHQQLVFLDAPDANRPQ